ncbi:MAG: hypothetical protein BA870_11415 [Desulfuromonadales bacterium C00003094]|nr:MAG: hypothetical protein BA870_11415 [Desulfuromonadales bacterium C00003094]OEU75140.1 MAG: hypothetical protein BA869_00310 [Desulfuromonadales bacterium C00003107]
MKCPKCNYQSFNNMTACKKCGRDLSPEQQKLNLGSPVVIPPAVHPPAEPIPAATEMPIAPAPTSSVVQEPDPQSDENMLEGFFQSIDSLDHDLVPSATPPTKQSPTDTNARSTAKRQTSSEVPQWSQESPQGDFPFDELDSDLDALRLSRTTEPVNEGALPFDDVDTFEINWQSPIDEVETTKTEPTAADRAINQEQLTEQEEPQRELPVTRKAVVPPPQPTPAERVTEAEPPAREAAREAAAASPPVTPAIAQQTSDKEWPLPEITVEHQAEKAFTLEQPCEANQPAAAPPGTEVTATQPLEVQEELPLAVKEVEVVAEQAKIAAIFQPDTEHDPIVSGARLLTRRAQAYLTDLGLLTAIFALFVCAGEVARSPAAGERFRFSGDVLLDLATPYFLVFFALCFGYFTLFHYLSGQTPGKMLFDVRVEGVEHAGITLAQAFLRCVGGLIALLPAGLGFLSIVLDEEQRGWNDRLAGCRVVMVEELEGD